MVSALLSRVVILFFGTLYPAYASYKAIRTKNVKEYVKWMMYWIVFALFCFIETFADVLLSWLPFYYEVKIIFVIWMLSPITRGSSFLYKKFVHPHLVKREKEIDEYISQYSKKGYSTLLQLGTKGISYATNVVVSTAIKGQVSLADHIRKSYSTNDLRVPDDSVDGQRNIPFIDEDDELALEESNNTEESVSQEVHESLDKSKIIEPSNENPQDLKVVATPKVEQTKSTGPRSKVRGNLRYKGPMKVKPRATTSDYRLAEDNRELERRKGLHRSYSDASEIRPAQNRYSNPTNLSRLEEESEEEREEKYQVRPGYSSPKHRSDPYATLPRTRARTRKQLPR